VLRARLIDALGIEAVKTAPEDLRAYAYDAYTEGALPSAVVLPGDVRGVCAAVKIARACGEPIVARGAGTGLCGGSVPVEGGIVMCLARMNRVLSIDVQRRRAHVQAGAINASLSQHAAASGLFYAPDPASQRSSTIGGNVATNAGGPHCLAYGTTTDHVVALEVVDDAGEVYRTGDDDAGYDLTALLTGSEGTLGIVTSAWVRLLRLPEVVRVAVAAFSDIDAASHAVSAIVASGTIPAALEMMDATIVRAVEAAFGCGYPADAGAVLLIEQAGFSEEVSAGDAVIAKILHECGALSVNVARDAEEAQSLWAGRKGAAGAMGRLAPNYYTQDVCVPRSRLPEALRAVQSAAAKYGVTVGNVFHAGDGNLHPLMAYDKRDPAQVAGVIAAGNDILQTAVRLGGTISGEHGVGYEKRGAMTAVYAAGDLAAMAGVRDVFDPQRTLNPEKIFPAGVRCPEVAQAGALP
jgi:glycolate oxidase